MLLIKKKQNLSSLYIYIICAGCVHESPKGKIQEDYFVAFAVKCGNDLITDYKEKICSYSYVFSFLSNIL